VSATNSLKSCLALSTWLVLPRAAGLIVNEDAYLDHQYIARETAGQPAHWQQLGTMLAANPEWRLAVSECNLLEIASDDGKARAQRRAAFIDSVKPTWMMERLDIQKCEVEAFLWKNHFLVDPAPFRIFHEHLSQMTIHHARPIIGETAASWVARINPAEIDEAKRQTVSSLRTLQAATNQQKQQIEEWVFRAGLSRGFRCEIPVAF
jgi:hypothetical protein